MSYLEFRFTGVLPACCLFAAIALQTTVFAQASDKNLSNRELIDTADGRIEKHRKSDIVITVVDDTGRPLPGAKVELRQTHHAFLFGCNIFGWSRPGDKGGESTYCKEFGGLFNFATLGFYWWDYERVKGNPNHGWNKLIAQWCSQHDIATKGHPLAWNFLDPSWAPDDPEELRRLQMARIDDCVSQFVGKIDCWDVVNEARNSTAIGSSSRHLS